MARADLILRLAEVAFRGDKDEVRRAIECLAADERQKQHHVLADRLLRATRVNGRPRPNPTVARTATDTLLLERTPERSLTSLQFPELVRTGVAELIEEQHRSDLLRSHGLEPRHRLLLVGPPGNGKTSLAEAIATELGRPLIAPAYHRIVGSLLGETASRLGKVFDEVRSRACVLFLDEIDVLAKERGDQQETGEIKRVVSSLLLSIDDLPPHVLMIGATNHPDLLDRAAWRRFELRLELPHPDTGARVSYLKQASQQDRVSWGVSVPKIAAELGELSFGELEQFVADVRRRLVLEQTSNGRDIVRRCIRRWRARAGPA